MIQKSIQYVTNFQELIATAFKGNTNAVCWHRELNGNFLEIVQKVKCNGNITTIEIDELEALNLSEEGQYARAILLNDLRLLEAYGAAPTLNIIQQYHKDETVPFFATDVYSFHVDRSPVPAATFLCTYYGESSELLPNADAKQKILIPEMREKLKQLYGEAEEGFEDFLTEHFFDLHYEANLNAQITKTGIGHLWRLAVDCPGSNVLPCIHRAPIEKSGEPRLLLIC